MACCIVLLLPDSLFGTEIVTENVVQNVPQNATECCFIAFFFFSDLYKLKCISRTEILKIIPYYVNSLIFFKFFKKKNKYFIKSVEIFL